MSYKKDENNYMELQGKIVSPFVYQTEHDGERFFMADILTKRISGYPDTIKVLVSEQLLDLHKNYERNWVNIIGRFQSYNKHCENKSQLILYGYAKKWKVLENVLGWEYENIVSLQGYICKQSVFRKTPRGKRVADILLAVNRKNGKSDYIPCIAWERNAKLVAEFEIGDRVQVIGRIQSRMYDKRTDNGIIKKVAYEVSVFEIEKM